MKSLASWVSMRSMPGFEEGRYQPRGGKVEIGSVRRRGKEGGGGCKHERSGEEHRRRWPSHHIPMILV